MQEITCLHCGASLLDDGQEDLAACPHCGKDPRLAPRERRIEAAKEVAAAGAKPARSMHPAVFVVVAIVVAVMAFSVARPFGQALLRLDRATAGGKAEAEAPGPPQLILEDWNWSEQHGYAIAEGEVTNVSSEALEHVQAVVSFYTAEGRFVKSATAIVELDPILPGQTSPFRAGTSSNPAIDHAKINFDRLLGDAVAWKYRP
jgi:DNA-directed RNA polymerase subunit RPC12/RpoP